MVNSMDWKNYEKTTAQIYAELNNSDDIQIIGYGNDCKVLGKSDVKHQIDVLTVHELEGKMVKTAIECKYISTKVSKDPVMKLAEIIEDADIEFGVIVSKNGFTDDAVKYALYKNISLIELRKPLDKDWAGKYRDMASIVTLYLPLIYDIEIEAESTKSTNGSVIDSQLVCSEWSNSLDEVINSKCRQVPWMDNELTEAKIEFSSYCDLVVLGEVFAKNISSISFKIKKHIEFSSKQEHKGDDLVAWYIMKVFEKEEIHIHKCGAVKHL